MKITAVVILAMAAVASASSEYVSTQYIPKRLRRCLGLLSNLKSSMLLPYSMLWIGHACRKMEMHADLSAYRFTTVVREPDQVQAASSVSTEPPLLV